MQIMKNFDEYRQLVLSGGTVNSDSTCTWKEYQQRPSLISPANRASYTTHDKKIMVVNITPEILQPNNLTQDEVETLKRSMAAVSTL